MGRPEAARLDYQQVTRSPVKNGLEYALRAGAYFAIGQDAAASSDYATAKRLKGNAEYVLNGAAWFEATCPESRFRDGKTAVRDAARACERGKWKEPGIIDTLAVAYAETGDFDRAISYESQAVNLAGALPFEKGELQAHLRLLQEHKPVREELKIK
jgi:Flp pilus assembly protein TadD